MQARQLEVSCNKSAPLLATCAAIATSSRAHRCRLVTTSYPTHLLSPNLTRTNTFLARVWSPWPIIQRTPLSAFQSRVGASSAVRSTQKMTSLLIATNGARGTTRCGICCQACTDLSQRFGFTLKNSHGVRSTPLRRMEWKTFGHCSGTGFQIESVSVGATGRSPLHYGASPQSTGLGKSCRNYSRNQEEPVDDTQAQPAAGEDFLCFIRIMG